MRRHFGKVVITTGVLAALGVGVWNAVELRQLREQMAAKPTDVPTSVLTEPTQPTLPPVTVAPPDILRIEVSGDTTVERQVHGEHLIRPDGTVSLGVYGSVTVEGLTLLQVKAKIAAHLRKHHPGCAVEVNVSEFNSRAFYVISSNGGPENVSRFPSTGNETVLDAVALVGGFPQGERKVWIARRGPGEAEQVLPVDWKGITERGHTRTNYQLQPDDRVFVMKAE